MLYTDMLMAIIMVRKSTMDLYEEKSEMEMISRFDNIQTSLIDPSSKSSQNRIDVWLLCNPVLQMIS